ncbi:MAG: hypothetical protein GTO18_16040 [Anaerolineales bacterium]|nr:hypothetical protein [Anaerolineales bacterium]
METISLEAGEGPKVKILAIGGDLRLSGRDSTQIDVKAPDGSDLSVEEVDDGIEIRCNRDCLVFLPRESRIDGQAIGGDMRATTVTGGIMIRMVGGDLSLRGVGEAVFETVGGDFHIRKGTSNVSVDTIGGDAVVDRISGDVRLPGIGGDLSIRRVDGLIETNAGGDSSVLLTTLAGERITVTCGGDLVCRLPQDASGNVMMTAGGDLGYPSSLEVHVSSEGHRVTLGEGDVEVRLQAGGDLLLRVGERGEEVEYVDLGASIAAEIESEMEAGIAEMEARLEAVGYGLDTFDSDRIGDQVRRAVSRARRRADRAQRRAMKHAAKSQKKMSNKYAGAHKAGKVVIEEERLAILRMLENGTITVEEAEKLLEALESGA